MKLNFFVNLLLFFFFISQSTLANESYYELTADKILYNNKKNLITATGEAKIFDKSGKKITSEKIIYNKKNGLIKSFGKSFFFDEKGNKIITTDLTFNSFTNVLNAKNKTQIIDSKNNLFELEKISYNVLTKIGNGENFKGNFEDGSKIISKKINFNLISGKSVFLDTNYTTCKKTENQKNEYCPWWSLKTYKTTHEQSKNTIKHENAYLKIKNIPILYSPYIEHPDPKVKRKSGFLPPRFYKLSNLGSGIKLPYFWDINQNEDMTITPVYHLSKKPSFLTEYRKKFEKSSLIIDTSYNSGYINNHTNQDTGNKNHFYLKFKSSFDNDYFKNNELNFQIQKVSETNYLKVNKINTLLTQEDDKQLENKVQFLGYNDNSGLDLNLKIFEDLNKQTNDKYEYVFPYGTYSYNFQKYNQNINFKSDFISRKTGSNSKSSEIINMLDLQSNNQIFKKFGTSHNLQTRLTNINYSSNEGENDIKSKNFITLALNNSLPLFKKKQMEEQLFLPKIFIKYTTGAMKNENNANKNFLYYDVFSLNRSSKENNPETGFSIGSGFDYEHIKKDLNKNIYLKNLFGIGQVFRTSQLEQLPIKSSLDKKQSSFAGYYKLSFLGKKKNISENDIKFTNNFGQNKVDIKYDFNLNNNLNTLDQNILNFSSVAFNRIATKIEFDEKNNYAGNERKIDYSLDLSLNQNFSISFLGVKDLKKNRKESESFGFNYENECIKMGLFLKKDFYSNENLSSEDKSIFFGIVFKPFANDLQTDLSGFVK